jgi:hypothetical protein
MHDDAEMTSAQLAAIRARLDEPPPVIALAGRKQGLTPIVEFIALLREDRIQLVDEIDRLRAEMEATGDPVVDDPGPGDAS